jgi:hypothetical protein
MLLFIIGQTIAHHGTRLMIDEKNIESVSSMDERHPILNARTSEILIMG